MPINTDPPYDRLETILMGGTVDPPYTRKELIAMQAGGGSGGGGGEGSGGGGRPAHIFFVQVLNEHPILLINPIQAILVTYQDILELYNQGYDLYAQIERIIDPLIYDEESETFYTGGNAIIGFTVNGEDGVLDLELAKWGVSITPNGYDNSNNYYSVESVGVVLD